MKKILLILITIPAISMGQLVGVSGTARTGIDTGGGARIAGSEGGGGSTGRSILLLDMNSVSILKPGQVSSQVARSRASDSFTSGSDAILSRFALDLVNVEEVTLKDGTVIKIENIREELINSATTLNE